MKLNMFTEWWPIFLSLNVLIIGTAIHGPLARYAKLQVRMRGECRERFPRHRR